LIELENIIYVYPVGNIQSIEDSPVSI